MGAGTGTGTERRCPASLPACSPPAAASRRAASTSRGRGLDRASWGTSAPVPADVSPATEPSFSLILDVPPRRGHLRLDPPRAAPERGAPTSETLPGPDTPTSSPALGPPRPPAGPSTAPGARGPRSCPAARPRGHSAPRPQGASAAPGAAARGCGGAFPTAGRLSAPVPTPGWCQRQSHPGKGRRESAVPAPLRPAAHTRSAVPYQRWSQSGVPAAPTPPPPARRGVKTTFSLLHV